ncbi:MAG: single-stranded DNA-binding protein [Bacteroidales bacterium]|nr:single-stranded DNA-binding protein [Bacteroidales bacterium]
MIGVNKVILIGNIGKDPEIVTFPQEIRRDDGSIGYVKKASFSLATTEVRKNKDGERIEQTEWHNVVCWRGLADIAERKLHKGTQVYIEGKLQSRSWEDREGQKHYITEVVAENFLVLGPKPRTEAPATANSEAPADPYSTLINEGTEPFGGLPF